MNAKPKGSKVLYVGRGALNLLAVLGVVIGLQGLIRGRVPTPVALALLSLAVVASYIAGVRWIEGRQASEWLPSGGGVECLAGLALGIALFTTVMLCLWLFGAYQPRGFGTATHFAAGFLAALFAAVFEETLFRAFLFRLTERLLGIWGALGVTSVLFGTAHAFNRGATIGSSVAIALEAGVLLGAAYALTNRMWLPVGLHLGWNFAEGSVFGMAVSGGAARGSLIVGTLSGNALLTGGVFGPEASVVAVVLCLGVALFLLFQRTHRPTPGAANAEGARASRV